MFHGIGKQAHKGSNTDGSINTTYTSVNTVEFSISQYAELQLELLVMV